MSGDDLGRLRGRIADIDRSILELARERIECAREIGRIKVESERPVRDFGTERIVMERTRSICTELGLPFELGEGVLHALIEEAVRVQEALRERSPRTSPARALVVGGRGGMGGWLCRYLESQGHRVSVADPRGGPPDLPTVGSLSDGWDEADVVVLAVPLAASVEVYDRVVELPPGPLVFDVFSVKTPVADRIGTALERGHLVSSVHPMFGPSARLLSGRALVICDTGSDQALTRVRKLFEATSLDLVTIPLAEHDRRMADALGLAHALSLVFARALAASAFDARELAEVASTTFRKQTRTTREVVSENPALYYDIQRMNPHTGAALRRLREALDALRAEVEEGRSDDFEREIDRARRFLGEL